MRWDKPGVKNELKIGDYIMSSGDTHIDDENFVLCDGQRVLIEKYPFVLENFTQAYTNPVEEITTREINTELVGTVTSNGIFYSTVFNKSGTIGVAFISQLSLNGGPAKAYFAVLNENLDIIKLVDEKALITDTSQNYGKKYLIFNPENDNEVFILRKMNNYLYIYKSIGLFDSIASKYQVPTIYTTDVYNGAFYEIGNTVVLFAGSSSSSYAGIDSFTFTNGGWLRKTIIDDVEAYYSDKITVFKSGNEIFTNYFRAVDTAYIKRVTLVNGTITLTTIPFPESAVKKLDWCKQVYYANGYYYFTDNANSYGNPEKVLMTNDFVTYSNPTKQTILSGFDIGFLLDNKYSIYAEKHNIYFSFENDNALIKGYKVHSYTNVSPFVHNGKLFDIKTFSSKLIIHEIKLTDYEKYVGMPIINNPISVGTETIPIGKRKNNCLYMKAR